MENLHPSEEDAIRKIIILLGLSMQDYQSIFSIYHQKDEGSVYKILEISPNASIDEVKNAYKTWRINIDPDKVSHLGEIW